MKIDAIRKPGVMAVISATVTRMAKAHDMTPMAIGATSWSTASRSLLKRFYSSISRVRAKYIRATQVELEIVHKPEGKVFFWFKT